METRKSEFDRPIALYDLLQYIKPDNGGPILYANLRCFVVYGDQALKRYLRLLETWGWIVVGEDYTVTGFTRPTENIILRPRPIQEVRS